MTLTRRPSPRRTCRAVLTLPGFKNTFGVEPIADDYREDVAAIVKLAKDVNLVPTN